MPAAEALARLVAAATIVALTVILWRKYVP